MGLQILAARSDSNTKKLSTMNESVWMASKNEQLSQSKENGNEKNTHLTNAQNEISMKMYV